MMYFLGILFSDQPALPSSTRMSPRTFLRSDRKSTATEMRDFRIRQTTSGFNRANQTQL